MQLPLDTAHLQSNPTRSSHKHHKDLWHWVMFCLMLATVPAFYLELAAINLQFQHIAKYIYVLVSAAISLWLAHAYYRQHTRQKFFSHYGLDLLIGLGAAVTAIYGSQNTWSLTEWILRSLFE